MSGLDRREYVLKIGRIWSKQDLGSIRLYVLDDCVVSGRWCQSVRWGQRRRNAWGVGCSGDHACLAYEISKSHSLDRIHCENTNLVSLLYYCSIQQMGNKNS